MKKMLLILTTIAPVAHAAPAALYAPQVSADAALLRVVNATSGTISATLPEIAALSVKTNEASPYRVFQKGNQTLSVKVGNKTLKETLNMEAGRYYTLAVIGEDLKIFTDKTSQNMSKARIHVYNLTAEKSSIKTADGSLTLLNNLPARGYDMLSVNPVKASLGAFQSKLLGASPETQLQANTAYSLFVFKSSVLWLQNSIQQ